MEKKIFSTTHGYLGAIDVKNRLFSKVIRELMVKEKVVANSANMPGKIVKKIFCHMGGT